jgi:hypothetical protein
MVSTAMAADTLRRSRFSSASRPAAAASVDRAGGVAMLDFAGHFICRHHRGQRPGARPARRSTDDHGQAIPLILGVVAVMAVLVVGVAWFGSSLVDAAHARTAADAAALAGAVEGQAAAVELAAENGAQLVGFRRIGDDVIVTVRCGRAVVSSRATANRAGISTLAFRDVDQPAR